jgi:hypothetical protein
MPEDRGGVGPQYRLSVSTRTLLILAALTGLAILVAFAVQVSVLAN